MVNFRFHLVSITAVFLALAVGIGLGATVVDQATVEALQRRLDGVSRRVDRTDRENEQLQRELARWSQFSEEASNEAVEGRLADVPVVVVAVQGVPRPPIEALQASLVAAGARFQGTVWLTSKLRLDKAEDMLSLASMVGGVTFRAPEPVRQAAVARMAASLSGDEPPGFMAALRDAAFVDLEAPGGDDSLLGGARSSARFVVVSSAEAEVPNDQLALPLVDQLARAARARVMAAEPGRDPHGRDQPGHRAVFVGPLRDNPTLAALVPTVDNLEDFRGRFATIYALRELGKGKVGHFGVGPKVTGLVPDTAS